VPGIWTSLTFHHRSIFGPIDRVFRVLLVISWRPERTALLTTLPRAVMLILIVRIAHAEAFMLHLAPSTPAKRKKRCITTNPLVTTRRFDQRRFGIAAEATMLASYRFGFHAVGRHGLSLVVALEVSWLALAHQMHRAADGSILSDHVHLNLTSTPSSVPIRACERAQTMSQLSKVKHGRNQWKAKAKQRSDATRYLRKQLARVKAERDRAKQALKDSQGRLRQLESQAHTVAVRSKVDVVWLSPRLFLAWIFHKP
jgi:hypothetical protein